MTVTRFAIRRPVTVSMFVVAVVLFGLVSLDRLALNLLPDISYPSLTIQTDYEDAAPQEVEALVTRPIEEATGVVAGLSRISSVSRSGQSEVVLEFAWDTNMDLASMDVREKLDLVALPEDAEKAVILRFDPTFDPIMRLQISGETSLSQLRYFAEQDLKKSLESVPGVAAVKVIGGREEQIRIEIDEKRLADLGIPITEVTDILRQENLNQASGSLYDLDANYLVRMLNEFGTVNEIRGIIIRNQNGRKVLLGDVARVWRGVKERDIIARLNGNESVEIAVYKEGDANTVSVSDAVHSRLQALAKSKQIPAGINHKIVFDQAEFIRESVDNVKSAAFFGGALATIVLFVFLRDLRSTVLIGLSIPISIMATFALMYQTDLTLNIMSLGGVALGVGMLVDNSIVVLESVHRHRQQSNDLAQAVYRGTSEVGMAVTASTLTTVAVFCPLVFVEGVAGQLFKDQALTITYSLLTSLAVALTLIPMLLALRVRKPALEEDGDGTSGHVVERARSGMGGFFDRVAGGAGRAARFVFVDVVRTVVADIRRGARAAGSAVLWVIEPVVLSPFERGYGWLSGQYPRVLDASLRNKPLVFATTFASIGLAAAAYLTLGVELIPPLTQGEFSFEIELPQGSPLERTDTLMSEVEAWAQKVPGVATVFSSVGGSNENQFAQNAVQEHVGQLHVVMKERRDVQAEQAAIQHIRQELSHYPGLSSTFRRPTLFSFKTPIEVEIYSQDLGDQRLVAGMVAQRLQRIEGLSDIQTSAQLGNPEIQIRFDRERLARLGLDEAKITGILRNKIRGDVASRYREGDKQIDILVRADEKDRNTIADLRNLIINSVGNTNSGTGGNAAVTSVSTASTGAQNQTGGNATEAGQPASPSSPVSIRLGSVADIAVAQGPVEIRRIRSQRAAIVSANLTGRDLGSVSGEIREELDKLRAEIPALTSIGLGGQNAELETSFESILFALALAVFLVYLVMASQFESLVHPFIILFSVPLALVGAVLSLAVTRTSISVMVFLGLIILAGIVVNNAIVLVDYANQLRQQGFSKRQALLEAGQVRLRPIVMTTVTTLLGLAPMAIGWGEGAEIRAPMAITVMGGLAFSTALTLIFIPVVYELVDRKVYATDESLLKAGTKPGIEPASEPDPGYGKA